MSQENVEIVRAAIDAYNRGDVGGAVKDVMPDFEYDQTRAVGIDRGLGLDDPRRLDSASLSLARAPGCPPRRRAAGVGERPRGGDPRGGAGPRPGLVTSRPWRRAGR